MADDPMIANGAVAFQLAYFFRCVVSWSGGIFSSLRTSPSR